MKTQGTRVTLKGTHKLHVIALASRSGSWIGNVILEYDDAERWGRLYSITDFGDYGCKWGVVLQAGFEQMIEDAAPSYLMSKLAQGHEEANTLDVEATILRLHNTVTSNHAEDADFLGEALTDLRRCETERDLWVWVNDHPTLAEESDLWEAEERGIASWLRSYQVQVLGALQTYLKDRRREDAAAME